MKRRLQVEIRQSKPLPTLEEEVYLELQRTSQVAGRRVALTLRPWGISESQFNVLRILSGCGPDGLPSSRIAERMVRYDPDLTRLMDQLEKRGLVVKSRDARDRRIVNSRITDEGATVVAGASRKLRETIVEALRPVGARKLGMLADLLELARQGVATDRSATPPAHSRPQRARPAAPQTTTNRRRKT